MSLRFPHIVFASGIILLALVYVLNATGLVNVPNEQYARWILMGIFVASVVALLVKSRTGLRLFSPEQLPGHTIVVVSLTGLLISLVYDKVVGAYATTIFIASAFLYFILNKKFYRLNPVYYFLFVYAALTFFGTIGTPKGFHFPQASLSYVLLPLAFCCFQFSKETLLRIAHVFFKAMIIYMIICIVYWMYNFMYLDISFLEWITRKSHFVVEGLSGWDKQLALTKGYPDYSAYYFVTSWIGYFHPSFISLVLFFGLTIGFYLHYKKTEFLSVSRTELILYIILSFLVIGLLESRIGIVGLVFIIAGTGLYYSKLKTTHFKAIVIIGFIITSIGLFAFDDVLDNFMNDNVRETDYTLAINYIKDNFWWGAGYEGQQIAIEHQEQLMKETLPIIGNEKTYTHNQFLGNMVQFGVWGAIILAGMLLGFLRYALKSRSYLLQMFMMIMMLFMMIEEPLYGQKGITTFCVFLTFFIAISESEEPRKSYLIGQKKEIQRER